MKFTVSAVVVVALLAVSTRASVVPILNPAGWQLQTVNINGVEGTAIAGGAPAPLVVAGPSVWPAATWPWTWPAAVQVAAPAPVPLPAPIQLVPAGASYVGQTRGSLHVAPLPGHSQSVSSVNLDPAPGSK